MRFESLIDEHHDEIYRYLWRLLASAGLRDGAVSADDLTQETFMRAYRAFGRLPKGSNARAWLYKIATNCAYSALSRQRPTAALNDNMADSGDPPERQAIRADLLDGLRGRIEALPPKQQGALVMRYLQGLDYAEIAAALECSESSARANVYQAVRRLRAEMAETGTG